MSITLPNSDRGSLSMIQNRSMNQHLRTSH